MDRTKHRATKPISIAVHALGHSPPIRSAPVSLQVRNGLKSGCCRLGDELKWLGSRSPLGATLPNA